MDNNSASLDEWRIFFKTANADIFGIIENAIMVAAMDYPNELKQKKSSITELLFTCKVTRCFGCNSVELALPNVYADEVEAMCKTNELNKEVETGKSNDTKPNGDGSDHFEMQLNANQMSNCSFGDAEALSDEIDQEFQTVTEVLRIKKILDNHGQESESLVSECLIKLQLMALSVETIKATDIAKSVSALKKQESKQIKPLVRALIEAWKAKLDEWVHATEAAAGRECTPESVKASVEEEGGLPSPPLDDGAFLTTNMIELSQFFDDFDDDGNLQKRGEIHNISQEKQNIRIRKQQLPKGSIPASEDRSIVQARENKAVTKTPLMASHQDEYTVTPTQQEAVVKKVFVAAQESKEQNTLAKKPSNASAQGRHAQKPKEHEAVLKKPSNAGVQDWNMNQPKEQEVLVKKPSNAAGKDWYTPQPKEQETVLKKPSNAAAQDWFTRQPKEQAVMKKSASIKPNKPSANGFGSGRWTKPTVEHKVNGNAEMKFQQKSDKATIDKRHAVSQQNKLNCPDEISFQERLAVAKRKLQERNQAIEVAKKQRTTQSVETHNIPKQNLDHKNTQVKSGNHSKQWTNGCR